ncbi:MAG TPA: L-lactate dehydrogenase [Lactococcus sp.]|uniref:L-lactate dehydrogenase n=1 Tax=Lactococcus TaxID=1357 RepID=UPI000E935B2D|nr:MULTISPECIES: L-lactate dehydrogenase [Lactococcus]MBL3717116.1 L-lactate dehydrogenase [Lactococcus garvieae]HAP15006.1 L-lactate dehydrogenase [Lactococcus sp.]HBC90116.1 L-lactate dehydrogenase [Lactococcus sp.]
MKVTNRKVVVIGTGFVGTSIAYSMINQGIVNDLVLIDVNQEKAEGEALDLLDGISWGQENINVKAGGYEECKDANVVVITAGINQQPGQTRLELVDTNAKIMKSIVHEVMNSGFDGVFVIASNPVDVLTYCAWKASGLPASRVVGTGTTLDTTRFRKELATKLEIDPRSIHGYIIGEHGDSEVAVWSHTTVGGKPILEFIVQNNRLEVADLQILSDKVKNAAYEIIDRKKATYYGIGMSTARIVKAILNNEQAVLPVSAYLEGQYGEEGLFTGVPSVVNQTGVREIIELNIDPQERQAFKKSVKQLRDVIEKLECKD